MLASQQLITGCIPYPFNVQTNSTIYQGGNGNSNFVIGSDKEELSGLQVTEKKRLRGGSNTYEVMDIEGGLKIIPRKEKVLQNTDGDLSELDCSSSSISELVKLAG